MLHECQTGYMAGYACRGEIVSITSLQQISMPTRARNRLSPLQMPLKSVIIFP